MKIFDEIGNMPSGGDCAARVVDVNGVKPVRQFRQAPETGTRTSAPELPLGAFEIANRIDVEASAGRTCAQAARRLQGVLKAHRDAPRRMPALTIALANSFAESPLRARN